MTSNPGEQRIPNVRLVPSNEEVLANLGLLAELAGTWEGVGFNLVARPDFEQSTNLFLELNLTTEKLVFAPIGSSIPNRGAFQDDIELFGLTYLQQISDSVTGGALHIEPGIWVTQPATTQPPESAPAGAQIIARMATIPHGNSVLAQGIAEKFSGPPTLSPGANSTSGANPAFSQFPSFNSTPFLATPGVIAAAGSSEKLSAPGGGFSAYTLTNAAQFTPPPPPDKSNARTPLGNVPLVPVVPSAVITQPLVNDPITFLQQIVQAQLDEGHTFEGVVLNIATQASIQFFNVANFTPPPPPGSAPPAGSTTTVSVETAGGGIENIPFLEKNADTALVYATFWIEKVTHPQRRVHQQLQYAQMVLLNFPAVFINIPGVPNPPNFSWPHITVGSLRKTFR
jgi:hypothetical protein